MNSVVMDAQVREQILGREFSYHLLAIHLDFNFANGYRI